MLKRDKYGIEYIPRPQDQEPSGLGWIVALVAIATLVSLGITLGKRLHASLTAEPETMEVVVATEEPEAPEEEESVAPTNAPATTIVVAAVNRPVTVKNLLLRLEEAARRHDIHMEATTLEQLRSQPGAEDLDDTLARRLGSLNMKRLFELRSREWVEQVEVKRGDSASRIASEHGTTFAAFSKLNGGRIDRVILGRKLYVMSRPKFSLTIHRRLRYADLKLNDKFFKRYDLRTEPRLANGAYEWGKAYVELPLVDRKELEMLLPRSTVTVISEL